MKKRRVGEAEKVAIPQPRSPSRVPAQLREGNLGVVTALAFLRRARRSSLYRRITAATSRARLVTSSTTSRYAPDPCLVANKKRRGARESSVVLPGVRAQVSRAMVDKSPLSQDIPRPRDARQAADSISDPNPRDIASFWGARVGRLSALISALGPHQKKWGGRFHHFRYPASSR